MKNTEYCEIRVEPINTGFLVRAYTSLYGSSEMHAFGTWSEVSEFIKNNEVKFEEEKQ